MKKQDLGERRYSKAWKQGKKMYITGITLGVIAVVLILIGLYISIVQNDWLFMLYFTPFILIFTVLAIKLYPKKREVIYIQELRDDGIYERWENELTGVEVENFIPFEEVNEALIGIISKRYTRPKEPDYFIFSALLILIHKDEYFFKIINSAENLQTWVKRLEANTPVIRYTDHDLQDAYSSQLFHANVNFSEIEGVEEDIVSKHLEKVAMKKEFPAWVPIGVKKIVENEQAKPGLPATRMGEKITLLILFLYNLIFATLVFPTLVVGDNGFIAFSDTVYSGYIGINLLIPACFVFWRRFQRWYNPILYAVAGLIGNSIGILIASFTNEIHFLYRSVVLMNVTNLIFWTLAMLIAIRIKIYALKLIERYIT